MKGEEEGERKGWRKEEEGIMVKGRRVFCPGRRFTFGETLMVAGGAADVRIRCTYQPGYSSLPAY